MFTVGTASWQVLKYTASGDSDPQSLTKSRPVSQQACSSVTSSVLQGRFLHSETERLQVTRCVPKVSGHPVEIAGFAVHVKRFYCYCYVIVWAACKGQFATYSDRIMSLNVSFRKRFLLAAERRIVGRVRAHRLIGFVFLAVLRIMLG
jgi:hypothetical protein